jgi:hypothetical protein
MGCELDHNAASGIGVGFARTPNMPTPLPDRKNERPSHSKLTGLLLCAAAATALFAFVALNPQAAKWISDSAGAEFANIQPETPAVVLAAKQAVHQP